MPLSRRQLRERRERNARILRNIRFVLVMVVALPFAGMLGWAIGEGTLHDIHPQEHAAHIPVPVAKPTH